MDKLEYHKKLIILNTASEKLLNFLDKFCGGLYIEPNAKINSYYLGFITLIDEILSNPEFKGINKEFERPFENLSNMEILEDADVDWHHDLRPKLLYFVSLLHKKIDEEKIKIERSHKTSGRNEVLNLGDEIEKAKAKNAPTLTIDFEEDRTIKINEVILSQPRFDNVPHRVFEYIFAHPNEIITREQLEKSVSESRHKGFTMGKKFEPIITHLGFGKELRPLFFPDISKSSIFFRNPVSWKVLESFNLTVGDALALAKSVKTNRKKRN